MAQMSPAETLWSKAPYAGCNPNMIFAQCCPRNIKQRLERLCPER